MQVKGPYNGHFNYCHTDVRLAVIIMKYIDFRLSTGSVTWHIHVAGVNVMHTKAGEKLTAQSCDHSVDSGWSKYQGDAYNAITCVGHVFAVFISLHSSGTTREFWIRCVLCKESSPKCRLLLLYKLILDRPSKRRKFWSCISPKLAQNHRKWRLWQLESLLTMKTFPDTHKVKCRYGKKNS